MSLLLELQDQIQDTEAAIARVERATATDQSPALLSMSRSLEKRRAELQQEFLRVAKDLGVDVCSYRIFETGGHPKLTGVTKSLGDFQQMFSVTYDALKNGPKDRTRLSVEVEQGSAFEFSYAFSGSIGVVLTMASEQMLFGGSEFDQTISIIREMASATTPKQVLEYARKLGPAPVRTVYRWASDNAAYGLGTDVQWRNGSALERQLFIQPQEFRRLAATIAETSDEESVELPLDGDLVGADIPRKSFHMRFDGGDEIRGSFTDAISESHRVELPKRYRAYLRRTVSVKYSTEEEETKYFLIRLEERP